MSGFECSTQCQHWLVSVDEQRKRRLWSYMEYQSAIEEKKAVPISSSPHLSIANESEAGNSRILNDNNHLIMVEEEEALLQYFCELLRQYCGPGTDCLIKTSWRVPNTAVVYFRRFYLHNSLSAHDPRVVLVACILLAGKTEEDFVAPTLLFRHINSTLEQNGRLQRSEEILLQGLGFDLQVYHPHSCMRAIITDVKSRFGYGEAVEIWSQSAAVIIDQLVNTEISLAFMPLALALAALLKTESASFQVPIFDKENEIDFSFQSYIRKILGHESFNAVMSDISQINPHINEKSCPPEQVKASLKKLRLRAVWNQKDVKKEKKKKNGN